MKTSSLLLSITLILFTAVDAKANVFIEPYFGYEAGRAAATTTSGVDGNANASGTAFGARLGYAVPLLWGAFDVVYATETTSGSTGGLTDTSAMRSSFGVVAGLKIPLLRAYAGYGFADTLRLSPTSGSQTLTGSSLKLGASFTGLPFINLNLEYIMTTYTSYDPNIFNKASANTLLATVSLPWEF